MREERDCMPARAQSSDRQIHHALDAAVEARRHWNERIDGDGDSQT
jgi:hypothetical protein